MYVAIVSNHVWTRFASYHHIGKPAVHAIEFGVRRTLCGRNANGWDRPSADLRSVNCKMCKPRLEKIVGCKLEELDQGITITCGE